MQSNLRQRGFTIVELLIVIVVIAILAAISIVAYNGIQTRARATSIISDLRATEKAFRAYAVTTGTSSWWIDNSTMLAGVGNSPISTIIDTQPDFKSFLQSPPNTDGLGATYSWRYDNDGDVYNGCSASTAGVSIAIQVPEVNALMQKIDDINDDGNLSCGKIRASGGWLLYGLSNDQSL